MTDKLVERQYRWWMWPVASAYESPPLLTYNGYGDDAYSGGYIKIGTMVRELERQADTGDLAQRAITYLVPESRSEKGVKRTFDAFAGLQAIGINIRD